MLYEMECFAEGQSPIDLIFQCQMTMKEETKKKDCWVIEKWNCPDIVFDAFLGESLRSSRDEANRLLAMSGNYK